MQKRFHPEGLASLVAAIVAFEDTRRVREHRSTTEAAREEYYRNMVQMRRTRVLELARAWYANNELDFENGDDWRAQAPRNGTNNRAHLDRRNLMTGM
jgi:hypothetical protein